MLALRTRLRARIRTRFWARIRTRPSGRPCGCFRTHESGALGPGSQDPVVKPTSPVAAIALVLLSIVSFIIGLWALMALTRIVLG